MYVDDDDNDDDSDGDDTMATMRWRRYDSDDAMATVRRRQQIISREGVESRQAPSLIRTTGPVVEEKY